MMGRLRTYSELIRIPNYMDRFEYLKLDGVVGEATFGFERYLNQKFYHSHEWKTIRQHVIVRDMGCDLGIVDREIAGRIFIHHMNPITVKDISEATRFLLNPEYLICTCKRTHDAIHYSDESILYQDPVVRTPNDTCPWKAV